MLTEVVATGVLPPPPPPPPPGSVLPEPPHARMAAARGTNMRRVRIGTPCRVADRETSVLTPTIGASRTLALVSVAVSEGARPGPDAGRRPCRAGAPVRPSHG